MMLKQGRTILSVSWLFICCNGDTDELARACRRNPTWKIDPSSSKNEHSREYQQEVTNASCSQVMGYKNPSSSDLLSPSIDVYRSEEWKDTLSSCMVKVLQKNVSSATETSYAAADDHHLHTGAEVDPKITQWFRRKDHSGKDIVVGAHVDFAFNDAETQVLEAMTRCVQTHFSDHQFEQWSWNQNRAFKDYTFLGGFVQLLTPGIAAQLKALVYQVWDTAGWMDPDPRNLGIRCINHVKFHGSGPLGIPHIDEDSLYTIMIALSDPQECQDCHFFFQSPVDESRVFMRNFTRMSAAVFLSNEPHCCTDLKELEDGDNKRSYVKMELWEHRDVYLGDKRGTPEKYAKREENDSEL